MGYRMTFPTFDNSAVDTRQVRRQRERLAKKRLPGSTPRTRTDVPPPELMGYRYSTSAYMPHVGGGRFAIDRERTLWRRLHAMASGRR